MMKLDILASLRKGVEFIETVTPIASALGVAPQAIAAIRTVTEIADNVNQRIKDGSNVLKEADAHELELLLGRLQSTNDQLMKQIENS